MKKNRNPMKREKEKEKKGKNLHILREARYAHKLEKVQVFFGFFVHRNPSCPTLWTEQKRVAKNQKNWKKLIFNNAMDHFLTLEDVNCFYALVHLCAPTNLHIEFFTIPSFLPIFLWLSLFRVFDREIVCQGTSDYKTRKKTKKNLPLKLTYFFWLIPKRIWDFLSFHLNNFFSTKKEENQRNKKKNTSQKEKKEKKIKKRETGEPK